jgi:photosystem II stability/assembly factor-like uncharacterized protein
MQLKICAAFLFCAVTSQAQTSVDTLLANQVKFRNIGPFRGGRVSSVTGHASQKNTFYMGATGGGVFKTIDGGSNWKNITDKYFGGSIGTVAVAPSDNTILYVGEGEHTLRGNVSEGFGMWRSDNGGKDWQKIGLTDTRHINRIIIHPKNPNIVWVAAQGHLFGPNTERGVFKTIDGGKTWKKVLYVNNFTGAADLIMEPNNPNVLYAGMWRMQRSGYDMQSGGEGSGLFKSTDGGETWKNISANSGLPKGIWGIVGVTVAPSNPDKVYTIIENKEQGGLYVSTNGGETFTLQNKENEIRQRAWYYSKIYVDPKNEDVVYAMNVSFLKSTDGGKKFTSIRTPHGDHHDLWINPDDTKIMAVADDGGAQITYDGGANWSTYMNQPTAQVYRVTTDNNYPYRVLAAQQDNSTFRILSRSTSGAITQADWQPTAGSESGHVVASPNNPNVVYGGNYSGYLSRLDHKTDENRAVSVWPDDPLGGGIDVAKYRFQWNFPIFFSPHNPNKLYASGNHLFVTENEGASWQALGPDLTTNDKSKQRSSGGLITKDNTGVEVYCTVFAATESALEKDLLWVGTDDGLIQVSKDGGTNWQNVTPPEAGKWMMWNCVEVDPFEKGTAYFAGTKYKSDDFAPYLFKTNNYGKTWVRINNGIAPIHFTRAIRADKKVKGMLYAGTEYGLYISYNGGANWKAMQLNLPIVPITDMTIKENDLIVGTQGRSIWILDDLTPLQEMANVGTKKLFAFTTQPAYRYEGFKTEQPNNAGQNPAFGASIKYFVANITDTAKASVELFDADNNTIKTFTTTDKDNKLVVKKGLNEFVWNLKYPDADKIDGQILWQGNVTGPTAAPGQYGYKLKVGNDSTTGTFLVKANPMYGTTDADYKAQFNFLWMVRNKFNEIQKAQKNIFDIRKQLTDLDAKNKNNLPKDIKQQIDTLQKQITTIEEALHQTKAKSFQDVLNFPIRLDDKIAGLYNFAESGNVAPAKQVQEVYTDLAAKADIQLGLLNTIIKTAIPQLNTAIKQSTIPFIQLKQE